MHNNYFKDSLLVAGSALLLSLQPIFASYAYADGANAWGVVLMRFLPPGLLLVLITKRPASLKRGQTLLVGALCGMVSVFYYSALLHIGAGLAAILLYLYPLLILLAGLAMKEETMSVKKVAALGFALLGIYLSTNIGTNDSAIGMALAICAAISCGAYIMICRRALPQDGGLASAGWIMLGASGLLLMPAALGQAEFPTSMTGYAAGLALSTICALLPMSMLIIGIQLMQKDADVGILSTLEPISTLFLAWLLLAEPLTGNAIIGASLIVAAVIFLLAPVSVKHQPTNQ